MADRGTRTEADGQRVSRPWLGLAVGLAGAIIPLLGVLVLGWDPLDAWTIYLLETPVALLAYAILTGVDGGWATGAFMLVVGGLLSVLALLPYAYGAELLAPVDEDGEPMDAGEAGEASLRRVGWIAVVTGGAAFLLDVPRIRRRAADPTWRGMRELGTPIVRMLALFFALVVAAVAVEDLGTRKAAVWVLAGLHAATDVALFVARQRA